MDDTLNLRVYRRVFNEWNIDREMWVESREPKKMVKQL
jgi:hypothetical protein